MQANLLTSTMKNGLILGALFSINFLFSASHNAVLALLTYAIMVAILVVTYRLAIQYRDKECDGLISYGQSFLVIVLSFFFAALVSSLVKYIYLQFINPEYLSNLLNETLAILDQYKFMPVTDDLESQMTDFLKPSAFSLQFIWVNTFIGMIVGVIMAAFVKKEKSLFDE